MLFSSMFFLWIFLPLVIAFYYGVNILPLPNAEKKMKYKNIVLLVAGIIFYAFGGLAYLGLLLLVILVNYAAGIIIATSRPGKRKSEM